MVALLPSVKQGRYMATEMDPPLDIQPKEVEKVD